MSHRRKVGRNATTGHFISIHEATYRPSTSVIETIEYPGNRRRCGTPHGRRRRSARSLAQEQEKEFKAGKDL